MDECDARNVIERLIMNELPSINLYVPDHDAKFQIYARPRQIN
jgi:hypothetical protein